jgi:aspartate/methionine/tyrosine aminotransferase
MFAKHEFTARVNLTGPDTEPLPLSELWQVAPAQTREWYESLTLGYTESPGHPELRELAARASGAESGSAVQIFAGATEAVFVLLNAVLEAGDHAIVIGPTYQLLIDVPAQSALMVTEIRLRRESAWHLDVAEIKNAIRPNTRLIVVNFPHNPTGYLPERAVFEELINLVHGTGILLLSDEIYWGIELDLGRQLPPAAAMTPNAVSLRGIQDAGHGRRSDWMDRHPKHGND